LNFVRPSSSKSENLETAFENPPGGKEFNFAKISLVFTGILILFVVGVIFSVNGSSNSPQTGNSDSNGSITVEETQAPVVPNETIGEANAKRKAESYLSVSGFSKKGLISQLKYEGFTTAEATYGVENIIVDWDEQAARKAEQYMSVQAFSANGLIAQLKYEGFTDRQAAYGAYSVGFRP